LITGDGSGGGRAERIRNEKGQEIEPEIIASTNDGYTIGGATNLHPFEVRKIGTDKILLTHKETNMSAVYIRNN